MARMVSCILFLKRGGFETLAPLVPLLYNTIDMAGAFQQCDSLVLASIIGFRDSKVPFFGICHKFADWDCDFPRSSRHRCLGSPSLVLSEILWLFVTCA